MNRVKKSPDSEVLSLNFYNLLSRILFRHQGQDGSNIGEVRCVCRAHRMLKDKTLPSSDNRYTSICCCTSRWPCSFCPQAVKLLNSTSAHHNTDKCFYCSITKLQLEGYICIQSICEVSLWSDECLWQNLDLYQSIVLSTGEWWLLKCIHERLEVSHLTPLSPSNLLIS